MNKRTKRNGGSQYIAGNQITKGTENTNISTEEATSVIYEVMASSKNDFDEADASVSSQPGIASMYKVKSLDTANHTPREQHADISCQDMEMQDIMVSCEKLLKSANKPT